MLEAFVTVMPMMKEYAEYRIPVTFFPDYADYAFKVDDGELQGKVRKGKLGDKWRLFLFMALRGLTEVDFLLGCESSSIVASGIVVLKTK
jgi:hypothetical protein